MPRRPPPQHQSLDVPVSGFLTFRSPEARAKEAELVEEWNALPTYGDWEGASHAVREHIAARLEARNADPESAKTPVLIVIGDEHGAEASAAAAVTALQLTAPSGPSASPNNGTALFLENFDAKLDEMRASTHSCRQHGTPQDHFAREAEQLGQRYRDEYQPGVLNAYALMLIAGEESGVTARALLPSELQGSRTATADEVPDGILWQEEQMNQRVESSLDDGLKSAVVVVGSNHAEAVLSKFYDRCAVIVVNAKSNEYGPRQFVGDYAVDRSLRLIRDPNVLSFRCGKDGLSADRFKSIMQKQGWVDAPASEDAAAEPRDAAAGSS